MPVVADLAVRYSADTSNFEAGTSQVEGRLGGLNARYGNVAKAGVAMGAAVAAGFGFSINAAANFEQTMSGVEAVMGRSTWSQFGGQLEQLALRLGKDTSFGAIDAAVAIEELGKAGISAENILSGAADAVVLLAEASGTGLVTSAEIAATAMNQFGLAGEDVGRVADILTNGANKAQASVESLGGGLSMVGTTASTLGIPIQDVVAALAALEDQGLSGTRAGTSLNAALSSIINPSGTAKKAMDELGLSMGQTFSLIDEKGNFKDLTSIIENVDAATRNLTQAERARFLNQIFGEQGGRAINALLNTQTEELKQAGKGWDDYKAAINEVGTAEEQAKIRMDNFRGSWEELMGTIETIGITLGSRLLGPLRTVVDAVAGLGDRFLALPGPVQSAIAAVIGVTGALAGLAGSIVLIGPTVAKTAAQFMQLVRVLPGLSTGIRAVGIALRALMAGNPILLALTAAIIGIGLAWKTNFLGFQDHVRNIAAALQTAFGVVMEFGQGVLSAFSSLRSAQEALSDLPGPLAGVGKGLAQVVNAFGDLHRVFRRGGLRDVFRVLPRELRQMGRGFREAGGELSRWFVGSFRDLTGIDLSGTFAAIGSGLLSVGTITRETIIPNVTAGIQAFRDFGTTLIDEIGPALTDLGGWIRDDALPALLDFGGDVVGVVLPALADFGGWLVNDGIPALVDFGGSVADWITGTAVPALAGFWDAISPGLSAFAGWFTETAIPALSGFAADVSTFITETAIPALSNLWDAVEPKLTSLGSGILLVTGYIRSFASDVSSWITGTAIPALQNLWDAVQPKLDSLSSKILLIAGYVSSFASDVVAWITGTAVPALQGLWDSVQPALDSFGGKILIIAGYVRSFALDASIWVNTAITWFKKLWDDVKPALDSLSNWFSTARTTVSNFKTSVEANVNAVIGFLKGIWTSAQENLEKVTGWFSDAKSAVEGVKTAVENMVGPVRAAFGSIKSAAETLLGPVVNLLGRFLDLLSRAAGAGGRNTPTDPRHGGVQTEEQAKSLSELPVPTGLQFDPNDFSRAIPQGRNPQATTLPKVGTFPVIKFPAPDMSAFNAALDAAQVRLGEFVAQVRAFGIAAGNAFADNILPGMQTAQTNVQTTIDTIQITMGLFVAQATAFGTAAGTAFETNLTTAMNTALTNATTALNNIQVAMGTFVSQATAFGTAAGNAFESNLTTGMNTAKTNATTAMNDIQTAMGTFVSQARMFGDTAGRDFATGIRNGMNDAVSAAQTAAGDIQRAMSSASSGAEGYGYAVGSRFADGLRNSLALVSAAAADLRALLPSSPAKKGPLSKPVSFDYITADLQRNAALWGGLVERGLREAGRGIDRYGPLQVGGVGMAGSGPRGNAPVVVNNHYHYHVLPREMLRIMEGSDMGRAAYAGIGSRSREINLGPGRGR